jgi:O-antigen/teichoic acid export membrane protein
VKSIFASLKWSFLQQFSLQILGLIVGVVLARLLPVSDFGIMGMIYVFMTLGAVFIDSGLSVSIIRSKEINSLDLNSVFYTNVLLSILFYLLVYFLSPKIALFYEQPILELLIRTLSISLIISSLFTIQKAVLIRDLKFKVISIVLFISSLISSIIGIIMAYLNYGVWSLVVINITGAFLSFFGFYYFSSWRPSLTFSWTVLKGHVNFGYKLLVSNLLDAFFSNSYYIVVGKIFNPFVLGLYTRSDSFKKTIVFGVSTPLKNILLPVLSKFQDNDDKLKNAYIFILQVSFIVVTPLLLFLIVHASQIFLILFGSKWIEGVPYFQILCIASVLYPISSYVVSFLNVKGRSDLVLKIESLKKISILTALIITWYYKDIYILLFSQIAISIIDFIINVVILKKIINIQYKIQFKKIVSSLSVSVVSCLSIYLFLIICFEDYTNNNWSLVISIILFPLTNFLLLKIIKPQLLSQIFSIFKNRKLN